MAQFFSIHPTHPQKRLVRQAAEIVRRGGVIAYPTDSCYALGCDRGNARGLERLRRIRAIDERHHLTLMCRDLAEMAKYAFVNDAQFQLIKSATPGSYTFILRARREVPRRLTRKKTIGVRVPDHPVAHALLAELNQPMLSTSLLLPGEQVALAEAQAVRDRLEHEVDLVIDAGVCDVEPSTVIDLSGDVPRVLREGKGSLAPFAVERV
jgi:tRNA threonylcarbamoyl adenosine modification protein (Sua5/YciO/YrdC/YwlC family)